MADESQVTMDQVPQAPEGTPPSTPAPETPSAPAPQEPRKMSAEEFNKALKEGKIDMSRSDPENLIKELVDLEPSKPAQQPEHEPQPQALGEQPTAQPKATPEAEKAERKFFKSIGELLEHAKTVTGEPVKDAYALIEKIAAAKKAETQLKSGLDQWQQEAVNTKAEKQRLQAELDAAKKAIENERVSREQLAKKVAQQDTPRAAVPQAADADEPEIEMPDADTATSAEWAKYMKQIQARERRIADKRTKALEEQFKKTIFERDQEHRQEIQSTQARLEREAQEREQARKNAEYRDNVMTAAQQFVTSKNEFEFGDGQSVRQKADEYDKFLASAQHVQDSAKYPGNPGSLARDYLNGEPNARAIMDRYAVRAPEGAKQFALLVDLEGIARTHNLYEDGRPRFDDAYALIKRRNGVDAEERSQSHADGVQAALNVVGERQATPPTIGAGEASAAPAAQPKATLQQIEQFQKAFLAKASTMTAEQRQAEQAKLDQMLERVGIKPMAQPTST